jgi:hypothetical protein
MPEVVVPCRDLDAAVAAFGALGFAIDLVVPADNPTTIVVVAPTGGRIRLVRDDPGDVRVADPLVVPLATPRLHAPAVIITRAAASTWHPGRAGMAYRDLVPDRLGGWLVASHIRIADGGPVRDYVHFHDVGAQILYCRTGWVRVVYEDQGEPLVMSAGDVIVQPPHIRHRVLECSPGVEVIEVATPAVHATYADRALALPTAARAPERRWRGQRFLHHRHPDIDLAAALGPGWRAGVVDARAPRTHATAALVFGFVLSEATLDTRALSRDDAFCIPPDTTYTLTGEVFELELVTA